MTQKDESPNASEGPYWSEELLAVLVVGLGDETQARETLEGIIQQALSGRALQGISEEALASYLSKLYERIAESVQDSDVARRRSLTKKVEVVTEAARKAVAAAYTELSEELLEERVAMAEELAQKQRPTALLPATARDPGSNGSNGPNEPSKRHHHVYIALDWLT